MVSSCLVITIADIRYHQGKQMSLLMTLSGKNGNHQAIRTEKLEPRTDGTLCTSNWQEFRENVSRRKEATIGGPQYAKPP
ncbi:hypothetical protein Tco_1419406 [Tanacetum coccineum]